MPTRLNRANAPPTLSRHAVDTARLAAPLAISQLSQMAMGVTDTILLGTLGYGLPYPVPPNHMPVQETTPARGRPQQ